MSKFRRKRLNYCVSCLSPWKIREEQIPSFRNFIHEGLEHEVILRIAMEEHEHWQIDILTLVASDEGKDSGVGRTIRVYPLKAL